MTPLLRLAEDFQRAQPTETSKRAQLGLDLMLEFTDQLGDPDAMAEIRTRFPGIARIIAEVPKRTRVDALRAKQGGQPLAAYATHVADFIAKYDKANEGVRTDVGFSLRHRCLGNQLVGDEHWPLVQDIRVGRSRQPRFALPDKTWSAVFPGWQGWGVRDDVEDRLRLLGVPRREVDARSQELLGRDSVHIPARDGVLFLDDVCMREQAKRLMKDGDRPFVRRARIDGQMRDVFALPATSFLTMRGVSYQIPSRSPRAILDRCRARLEERGLSDPDIRLARFDGEENICMPMAEALTLIAPSHPGDAAAQLTLERYDYDPTSYDYDPEIGVLLVQAAMLSYEDDETIRLHTDAWGFQEVESFAETRDGLDAQAFAAYDTSRDTVMIAFRGSESTDDFRADADFSAVDGAEFGGGRVQEGFAVQLRALLPKLRDFLARHSNAKIMLGGHSLGGAMAALFRGWCLTNDIHVDHTYTCGQPPAGDEAWQAEVDRLAKEKQTAERPINMFRYVYGTDPVPHAPKFVHTGTLLYVDDDGKLQDPRSFVLPTGFMNLVGRVWNSLDNSFLHHRCPSYLGIVRKNRSERPTTK